MCEPFDPRRFEGLPREKRFFFKKPWFFTDVVVCVDYFKALPFYAMLGLEDRVS